jgi:hypothetical protein
MRLFTVLCVANCRSVQSHVALLVVGRVVGSMPLAVGYCWTGVHTTVARDVEALWATAIHYRMY